MLDIPLQHKKAGKSYENEEIHRIFLYMIPGLIMVLVFVYIPAYNEYRIQLFQLVILLLFGKNSVSVITSFVKNRM